MKSHPDTLATALPLTEAATVIHLASSTYPNSDPIPSEPVKASWRSLFAFTKRSHVGVLSAAIVASAATAVLRTVLAIFLGRIFDIIAEFGNGTRSGDSALELVSRWCLALLGLGLGSWLASAAFLALWITFGEMQADGARHDILKSLLARDLAWFDSLKQGTSSLLVRVQTQTRELQLATSQVFGFLICDAISSCASLAIALYYSWKLTLVLLATLPVSLIALSLANRPLEPAIQAQKAHLETTTKLARASMTGIDLVRVFGGLETELSQYFRAVKSAAKQYLIQARCNSIQMGYVAFWVISIFVLGFWYGLVLARDGLPPGHVLTTFYSTLAAAQGIEALIPHWLVLSKGMSAGRFLSSIASSPHAFGDGAFRLEHCVGDVQLNNVSFAYPSNPSNKVLKTSSFTFPAGQTTFIVGKSGSGKSTVGSLVAKHYKPLTGEILIDEQPLDVLDDKWVRENVVLIQQLSVLFSDTLFNNIALGHLTPEKATPQEVLGACQAALLQSTLACLPRGLDTNVGPNGCELSGGQKQKVSLARARLRDPTVLILDEVTSGLDQVSRSLVMDAIRAWRKDKTTIIITHDMSHIGDEEYVYVMDSASVVQKGFRRDLSGLLDCAFSALVESPAEEPVELPSQINVISPDSNSLEARVELSHTHAGVSPSGRWSVPQALVGELESSAILHRRSGLLLRTSLGVGTAYAWKKRAEEVRERPISPRQPPSGERIATYLETEKTRISTLVKDRFSPTMLGTKSDNLERCYLPTPVRGDAHWDVLETSSDFTESEVSFIFGAAERRKNISGLRLTSTLDGASALKPPSTLSATNKSGEEPSLLSTLKTVWPSLGRVGRLVLVLGIMICLVGAASTPAFAYCLARLLGVMWSPGDRNTEGRKWAIYLVGIAIVHGLCTGGGRYLLEKAGQAWVDNIRTRAFGRILQQPKSWFDKNNSPGRINECLERNAEEMRNIVGRFVPIMTVVIGIVSISVFWALAISWKLTLVALAPLPLVVGAINGYAAVSSNWEGRCNEGAEDSSALLTEIFLNFRVVRALTLEKHFERKYRDSARRTFGMGLSRAGYTCWLFGLYQSTSYALTALVFYYGMFLLAKERNLEVTGVLQVVNLLLFSIGTSSDVLGGLPQLTMAQATAVQLLGYVSLPLERPEQQRWSRKLHSPLPVRMHDLTFSYPRRAQATVLRRVSLQILPGECTALVGQSGCGKSTIISLLLGLYTPSSDSGPDVGAGPPLTFADVSYSDIDMQHLRSTMAYVSQTPFLFPATIAENIAYGLAEDSPHRHSQSVALAAQAAGLHEFIVSLPQGYSTLVGDGGQALSGGQTQRLSIARALVRQPRLLVMDEPTSALDAENSETIRQTIRQLVQQRSRTSQAEMAIVIVTHSREMMRVADKIIVIDDGIKVEEGSYQQLMEERGSLYHLISGGQWVG